MELFQLNFSGHQLFFLIIVLLLSLPRVFFLNVVIIQVWFDNDTSSRETDQRCPKERNQKKCLLVRA